MAENDEMLTQLPVRARATVVLCTLERTLSLVNSERVAREIRNGIEVAWMWEMGEMVSGHTLYQPIERLNEFLSEIYTEEKLESNDRQVLALMAAVYGLYYVCWEAVNQEVAKTNDLAEVTDDYMTLSLEYAARAAGNVHKKGIGSAALRFRLLQRGSVRMNSSMALVQPAPVDHGAQRHPDQHAQRLCPLRNCCSLQGLK
jgi:immunity protein Imm6 of predicted polymorphic toxin system